MMMILRIIIMAIVSISIIQLLPLLLLKRTWFPVPVCKSYHD